MENVCDRDNDGVGGDGEGLKVGWNVDVGVPRDAVAVALREPPLGVALRDRDTVANALAEPVPGVRDCERECVGRVDSVRDLVPPDGVALRVPVDDAVPRDTERDTVSPCVRVGVGVPPVAVFAREADTDAVAGSETVRVLDLTTVGVTLLDTVGGSVTDADRPADALGVALGDCDGVDGTAGVSVALPTLDGVAGTVTVPAAWAVGVSLSHCRSSSASSNSGSRIPLAPWVPRRNQDKSTREKYGKRSSESSNGSGASEQN